MNETTTAVEPGYTIRIGEPHEVTQTITYSPDSHRRGIYGNCMQAAVASVLGLPLEAVPHFVTFANWDEAFTLWLAGVGLVWRVQETTEWPRVAGLPVLVCGRNPDGVRHIVAVFHEGHVWDPNPSRAGLVEVDEVWHFDPRKADSDA